MSSATPPEPDPRDEALRRLNQKVEKLDAAANAKPSPMTPVPKAMAPMTPVPKAMAPMTPVPKATGPMTPVPRTGGAPMTPVPKASSPMTPAPISSPEMREAMREARIIDQNDGHPKPVPTPRSPVAKRVGILLILGVAGAFLGHQILDSLNREDAPRKKRGVDTAPAAPVVVMPDPTVDANGRTIYPDIPYPVADVTSTGIGTQYSDATGKVNINLVQVGIVNSSGQVEYVPGDDPRAIDAIKRAQEDSASAELAEQSSLISTTRPSENQAAKDLRLPSGL